MLKDSTRNSIVERRARACGSRNFGAMYAAFSPLITVGHKVRKRKSHARQSSDNDHKNVRLQYKKLRSSSDWSNSAGFGKLGPNVGTSSLLATDTR